MNRRQAIAATLLLPQILRAETDYKISEEEWIKHVKDNGIYPQHSPIRWNVNGIWRVSHATILRHLRTTHRRQFPVWWPVEKWPTLVLRSLHDDVHENRRRQLIVPRITRPEGSDEKRLGDNPQRYSEKPAGRKSLFW